LTAQRDQIALRPVDLEATVGPEHAVRNVWAFVERLDLSPLYAEIADQPALPLDSTLHGEKTYPPNAGKIIVA